MIWKCLARELCNIKQIQKGSLRKALRKCHTINYTLNWSLFNSHRLCCEEQSLMFFRGKNRGAHVLWLL